MIQDTGLVIQSIHVIHVLLIGKRQAIFFTIFLGIAVRRDDDFFQIVAKGKRPAPNACNGVGDGDFS